MNPTRPRRAMTPGPLYAAREAVIAIIILAALAAPADGARPQPSGRAPAPVVAPPAPPVVHDTATNLQMAFGNEVNAKDNYARAAKKADSEGYPAVARLFRACSRAEQVHADRHVQAIAWTSQAEARAVLDRPAIGTTPENLRAAIDHETYEVNQFYPPLIERARAEHRTMAVRSLTFALSAEREHVGLLTGALEHLGEPAGNGPLYVCPYCGKTVAVLAFTKCPNCFTAAKKFVRVT